jgi:hypothetical protein
MGAFPHQKKQDTPVSSISHCIKLITAVCLGFQYEEFKNLNNQQPYRTLLPHMITAALLLKKFLAF